MRIVNKKLLVEMRSWPRCEWSGETNTQGLDPAHCFATGMGSGSRLDHRLNVAAIKRCYHTLHHDGKSPTRMDLLEIISRREGVSVERIIAWKDRVLSLPKGSPVPEP